LVKAQASLREQPTAFVRKHLSSSIARALEQEGSR